MANCIKQSRHPVRVRFYDHTECSGILDSGPYVIDLFGLLVQETPLAYHIATWITGEDLTHGQTTVYTVLKSTIIEIKRYSPGTKKKKPRSRK